MKKKLALWCVLCLVAGLLAACSVKEPGQTGTEQSSEQETKADDSLGSSEKRVGIIYPTLSNEFLANQAEMIKEELNTLGMEVDLVSADNDPAKELQQLENFASMNVDSILLFPIGASAGEIGPTLQGLRDQGIQVVVIGNAVEIGTYDSMIIVNQTAVGEKTAEQAAEWIDETFPDAADGSVEVALFKTSTSVESKEHSEAMERVEDFTSKAKIVETYDIPMSETVAKVQEHMDMLLTTHPDVKVILTYDATQALAADETAMGKSEVDKAQFGIFASDLSEAIGERIQAGASNESLIRATNVYGDGGVTQMIDAIKGTLETDEDNICYLEIFGISSQNIEQFIGE